MSCFDLSVFDNCLATCQTCAHDTNIETRGCAWEFARVKPSLHVRWYLRERRFFLPVVGRTALSIRNPTLIGVLGIQSTMRQRSYEDDDGSKCTTILGSNLFLAKENNSHGSHRAITIFVAYVSLARHSRRAAAIRHCERYPSIR